MTTSAPEVRMTSSEEEVATTIPVSNNTWMSRASARLAKTLERTLQIPIQWRALIAVGLSMLTLAVRELVNRVFGLNMDEYPFALIYPGMLLTTVYFGSLPGLIGGTATVAVISLLYMPPLWNLEVHDPIQRAGLAALVIYLAVVTVLVGVMHRIMDRLRHSEQLRAMLFMEFRHRSRNDLNGLYAMLMLRSRDIQEPNAKRHMVNAARHTLTLAKVYKRLETHHFMGGRVTIDTKAFIEGLMEDIVETQDHQGRIMFNVQVESNQLGFERAIQLGLILNEMVTNAVKYAFPEGRSGTVTVQMSKTDEHLVLEVKDDGIGIEAGAKLTHTETGSSGLGTRLINGFARQLGGRLNRASSDLGGTQVTLRFPAK